MNRVVLTGRMTKDPDVRQSNETQVARFSLAVDRRGKRDETDFISCVAFNKTAELIGKYTHKGSKVGVEGRIQTGSYEKNGVKVYTTDVVLDSVEFLDSRGEAQSEQKPASNGVEGFMQIPDGIEEELPFK